MPIDHILAVASVTDLSVARPWYARLIGREPDNSPMDDLVEWRVTDNGWLQVFHDPERAGRSLVNFAVDDLDRFTKELSGRGLAPGEIRVAFEEVRLSTLVDPDGNQITLIGGFRVAY